MSGSVFLRTLRGVVLFVAGMVAAGTSISIAAPVTPAATQTRVTSCSGLDFHPIASQTGFNWSGGGLYRTDTNGSHYGFFLCEPQLPNKATVTRVRFTVRDGDTVGQIRYCSLYRQGITTSSADDDSQIMADAGDTDMAGTPGYVRLSDSSIAHATVDHANYVYWLQCQINFSAGNSTSAVQIFGADVTYRISSTNG